MAVPVPTQGLVGTVGSRFIEGLGLGIGSQVAAHAYSRIVKGRRNPTSWTEVSLHDFWPGARAHFKTCQGCVAQLYPLGGMRWSWEVVGHGGEHKAGGESGNFDLARKAADRALKRCCKTMARAANPRKRRKVSRAPVDQHAARELELYIDNDALLYEFKKRIHASFAKKLSRWDAKKALKGFMYLVDEGAKKYAREFGGSWSRLFNKPTREVVAAEYVKEYRDIRKTGRLRNPRMTWKKSVLAGNKQWVADIHSGRYRGIVSQSRLASWFYWRVIEPATMKVHGGGQTSTLAEAKKRTSKVLNELFGCAKYMIGSYGAGGAPPASLGLMPNPGAIPYSYSNELTGRQAGKLVREQFGRGRKLPKVGRCLRLMDGRELCHDANGYYLVGSVRNPSSAQKKQNPEMWIKKEKHPTAGTSWHLYDYVMGPSGYPYPTIIGTYASLKDAQKAKQIKQFDKYLARRGMNPIHGWKYTWKKAGKNWNLVAPWDAKHQIALVPAGGSRWSVHETTHGSSWVYKTTEPNLKWAKKTGERLLSDLAWLGGIKPPRATNPGQQPPSGFIPYGGVGSYRGEYSTPTGRRRAWRPYQVAGPLAASGDQFSKLATKKKLTYNDAAQLIVFVARRRGLQVKSGGKNVYIDGPGKWRLVLTPQSEHRMAKGSRATHSLWLDDRRKWARDSEKVNALLDRFFGKATNPKLLVINRRGYTTSKRRRAAKSTGLLGRLRSHIEQRDGKRMSPAEVGKLRQAIKDFRAFHERDPEVKDLVRVRAPKHAGRVLVGVGEVLNLDYHVSWPSGRTGLWTHEGGDHGEGRRKTRPPCFAAIPGVKAPPLIVEPGGANIHFVPTAGLTG